MKGLRILKLSDAWVWTAEAENLVTLGGELTARGHQVAVGCTAGTPLATRALAAGLEVLPIPGLRSVSPLAFGRAVSHLRRLIRERLPDLVHTYRSPVHVIAALALSGTFGTRLVRTRGTMETPRAHLFNRTLYDRATDLTLVTSQAVKRRCLEAGFDPRRLVVLPGGLDLTRFDPSGIDRQSARTALGVPASALLVGQLARLAPVKGQEFFLRAAREVLSRHPEAWFALVGPPWPGMAEKVRAWAREAGVEGRTVVTGEVPDPRSAVAAFHVGVVASVGSEALSRAALEYLALGVPVVATRVGSLPEILEEGVTGLLVPPADPPALAAAISALLADPEKRAAFARAGRASVEQRFSASAQASALEEIYRDLLATRLVGARV